MLIETVLLTVLIFRLLKWHPVLAGLLPFFFYMFDGAYFAANMTKIPDGGWFPLLVVLVIFTLLTTWAKGRQLMLDRMREAAMPIPVFVASAANSAVRVPGTAVFMTSTPEGVPHALLHNLKHNKVLHERVILLTVRILDEPFVEEDSRYKLEDLGRGFFRVVLKYGFMQEPDVPAALKQVTQCGAEFKMRSEEHTSELQSLMRISSAVFCLNKKKKI